MKGLQTKRLWAGLKAAMVGVLLTVLIGLGISPAIIHAEGPDQAKIIVQFDEQDALVRGAAFTGTVSGLDALILAGLNVITTETQYGIALCSINGVGCPAESCFTCDPDGKYWGYNYWQDGAWQAYMVGAADSAITDGAIEGYRWGAWGDNAMLPASPFVSADKALNWLQTRQAPDNGGYGSNNYTVEAMLAAVSNRCTVNQGQPGSGSMGSTIFDYWTLDNNLTDAYPNNAAEYAAASGATAGKLIVAATGGSLDPKNFAGIDLTVSLTHHYSPTTGAFGLRNLDHAWGILGWRAAFTDTIPVPVTATNLLASQVLTNGGWAWSNNLGPSDTNSTALAVQALIAAGKPVTSSVITRALAYLKTAQNEDGGFAYDPASGFSTAGDANSTAYVVQALIAAGEDPISSPWTTPTGANPITYLRSAQQPNGGIAYQPGSSAELLATSQAIPALLGKFYPLHYSTELGWLLDQNSLCRFSQIKQFVVYLPVVLK